MRNVMTFSVVAACSMLLLLIPQVSRASKPMKQTTRFAPVHIYLDSGGKPLAAYQFELVAWASRPWIQNHGQDARATVPGTIKIVGVEGGEHPAFREAPYYDPAALMNDRIIIAAFNTGRDLPSGRTRIATLHLQILGDAQPEYQLTLVTAADADGQTIPATLSLQTGENQ